MNYIKILFLILFLILCSACNQTKKTSTVQNIEFEKVECKSFKEFHGLVKSEHKSELSFQNEGRVNFIPYSKGDYVIKGQVLARLDGDLYKIRKSEEEAKLKDRIIQYNKSKSYYKRMDILHKEGAISDNDWEDAYYNLKRDKEQIRVQREKLKYMNEEIKYNIIVAPFNGFISDRFVDMGSFVKSGDKVLSVIEENKSELEAMVDTKTINNIKLEENVYITRNNKKYEGKIKHISKSSIDEGGYLVKISLDKLYSELKNGMDVQVIFPINNLCRAIIPIDSIVTEDSEKYVYKIINIENNLGEIKKEKIETGDIIDNKIEILNGLKKDDLIILNNLSTISQHAKVKIKNE